jgi:hypothetical protein
MNTGRGFDPQPPPSVQPTSSEKATHPLHGCVGQLDLIAHDAAPSCIDRSEHWNRTAPPIPYYLAFCFLR